MEILAFLGKKSWWKAVFAFIVLFVFQSGFSQFDKEKKHEITVNLLSPIVSTAPRYNVGYYYQLKPSVKVGLTAGYGNKKLSLLKGGYDTYDEYQLLELRPEISYLFRLNKKTPHFVSLELFYIQHTDVFHTDRYYEGGYAFVFDKADYKRIKSGFNINYGMQISLAPNFGLIPQIGFGLKNRMVSFENLINERVFPDEDDHRHSDIFGVSAYLEQGGRQVTFNFNAEIKVFYRF